MRFKSYLPSSINLFTVAQSCHTSAFVSPFLHLPTYVTHPQAYHFLLQLPGVRNLLRRINFSTLCPIGLHSTLDSRVTNFTHAQSSHTFQSCADMKNFPSLVTIVTLAKSGQYFPPMSRCITYVTALSLFSLLHSHVTSAPVMWHFLHLPSRDTLFTLSPDMPLLFQTCQRFTLANHVTSSTVGSHFLLLPRQVNFSIRVTISNLAQSWHSFLLLPIHFFHVCSDMKSLHCGVPFSHSPRHVTYSLVPCLPRHVILALWCPIFTFAQAYNLCPSLVRLYAISPSCHHFYICPFMPLLFQLWHSLFSCPVFSPFSLLPIHISFAPVMSFLLNLSSRVTLFTHT